MREGWNNLIYHGRTTCCTLGRYVLYAFWLAVLGLGFGTLLAFSSVAAEINTESAVQVCISKATDEDGNTKCGGHGSGVYIGDGYVLTAAHVAEGADKDGTVQVNRPRSDSDSWNDSWTAEVLWTDKRQDFALLKLRAIMDESGVPAAVVSCEPLKMQQPVTIVGWPLSLGRIQSRGYVASKEDKQPPHWAHAYVVVAPVTFGNSGGPVYDDAGKVVGLAVGIVDGTSLSFVIPTFRVCSQLPHSLKGILDPVKTRADEEAARK